MGIGRTVAVRLEPGYRLVPPGPWNQAPHGEREVWAFARGCRSPQRRVRFALTALQSPC